MADPARILLADDHPLVARALSGLFSREDDLEVVGHVTDLAQLWNTIGETEPDVLILDLGMPGGSGMDALRRLRKRHTGVRVLVLSGLPEEEFVARVIEAGASGYVQKLADPETLVAAVRKVAGGDVYVSERGATALARAAAGRGLDHESLSERELQVLRLLGEGKSVSQIADTLFLSPKTISTYRARLMEKMGFSSTAEVIRYAVQRGLVE